MNKDGKTDNSNHSNSFTLLVYFLVLLMFYLIDQFEENNSLFCLFAETLRISNLKKITPFKRI